MIDRDVLRVTMIQTDIVWENVDLNLQNINAILSGLEGTTDVVVLPEMFATGFSMDSKMITQPKDGAICKWLAESSRRYQFAIAAGVAVSESSLQTPQYSNCLVWTEPTGVQQFYSKKHLFRMAGENSAYSPGNDRIIIQYCGWKLAPFVCYDLRFPVWSRNAEFGSGDDANYIYDCAIYIANWPESRSYQWKSLLVARAIENQCFVIGVNRVGTDDKGYSYSGDTAALSPIGKYLSNFTGHSASVETVILDKNYLSSIRRKFPFILDADNFQLL